MMRILSNIYLYKLLIKAHSLVRSNHSTEIMDVSLKITSITTQVISYDFDGKDHLIGEQVFQSSLDAIQILLLFHLLFSMLGKGKKQKQNCQQLLFSRLKKLCSFLCKIKYTQILNQNLDTTKECYSRFDLNNL